MAKIATELYEQKVKEHFEFVFQKKLNCFILASWQNCSIESRCCQQKKINYVTH